MVSELGIAQKLVELVPAGRFCIQCGMAIPLPGYTIITTPFENENNEGNKQAYEVLAKVQDELLKRLDIPKYAKTPKESFHMTVADLISKQDYMLNIERLGREDDFVRMVRRLFTADKVIRVGNQSPEMLINGLSLFPSFVIAVVSSEDKTSYNKLLDFRNAIYSDKGLQKRAIKAPGFKYTFHVTLAYIEDYLTIDECKRLKCTLAELNQRYFATPLPFKVLHAELRKFNDMSCFYRQRDWPVFHFTSSEL